MKRRYMILGLAVLLALVLLVGLVGTANAKAEKKTEFQAITAMMPYPNMLAEDEWVYARAWDGPDGLWHVRDWLWWGQNFLPVPPNTEPLEFLTGYCENYINVNCRFGVPLFEWANTAEKAMLYVGCESRDDVGPNTSIWRLSSVGKIGADGMETLTGVGHGVNGEVTGWVMHFTAEIDFFTGENLVTGYYIQK